MRHWARRFWQASTDHRGVPGAPGCVVTLVPKRSAVCWGVAYALDARAAKTVFAKLDHREKGGYERVEIEIEMGRERQKGVTYVAGPENPNYLGHSTLREIAETVRSARGPSGDNVEYVLRLAAALRAMGAEDAHVFELARLVGE